MPKLKLIPKAQPELEVVRYDGDNNAEILEFVKKASNVKVIDDVILFIKPTSYGVFQPTSDNILKEGEYVFIRTNGDAAKLTPVEKERNWTEA